MPPPLPPRWSAFLDALSRCLHAPPAQEGRLFAALTYAPTRAQAAADEILVGMGRCAPEGDAAPAGVFFTIKGLPAEWDRGYRCVSDLVLNPPEALGAAWARFAGGDFDLAARLPGLRLVVKDISPDSCLGLVLLLARFAGALGGEDGTPEAIEPWLARVRRWEQGQVLGLDDRQSEWCLLHSSLVHAFIDEDQMQALSPGATAPAGDALGRAWLHGLRYLVALLSAGADPTDLSRLGGRAPPEQRMAEAALEGERQAYEHALKTATLLQLALPIRGLERRRLVDAYLTTELLPAGAAKVFLRNDREHAWTRQGFALMGIHLPHLRGVGGHITLSVEPDSGLHLQALWQELERLEEVKWQGGRPRNAPRPIRSYPDANGPNEPWWDDHGRYTLLGAPRTVEVNGEILPGSRLEWAEVVDALWRVYHPLHGIRLLTRRDDDASQVEIAHYRPSPAGEKGLLRFYWPRPEVSPPRQAPLVFSPTLRRVFGALAAGSDGGALTLPQEDEFDFIPLAAGHAWVHRQGALLLDDWRPEALPLAALEREFDRACEIEREAQAIHEKLSALAAQVSALIAGRAERGAPGDMALLRELAELQARLRDIQTRHCREADGHDPRAFRAALERRWTPMAELDRLAEEADQIATTIRNYSEVRSNRMLNLIGVYGFPLVFWAAFFQFVLQGIPGADVLLQQGCAAYLHQVAEKIHWPGVGMYLLLTALSMGLLQWLARRLGGSRGR